jgi:hypothetical protein
MAATVFCNVDVLRCVFSFLEPAPKLVAAVLPCSSDLAAHTRFFVPGFSKTDMLCERNRREVALRRVISQQGDRINLLLSEMGDYQLLADERDEADANYEAVVGDQVQLGIQIETMHSECARAQWERDSMADAFAEHVMDAGEPTDASGLTLLTTSLHGRLATATATCNRMKNRTDYLEDRVRELERRCFALAENAE